MLVSLKKCSDSVFFNADTTKSLPNIKSFFCALLTCVVNDGWWMNASWMMMMMMMMMMIMMMMIIMNQYENQHEVYVLFVLETGIRSSFEVFDRCRQSRHPWRRSPILYRCHDRKKRLKRNEEPPRENLAFFFRNSKKNIKVNHCEHGWFLLSNFQDAFILSLP